MGGTVWQVGEEAMHPGAEGRKVVIFFVHFEISHMISIFEMLQKKPVFGKY